MTYMLEFFSVEDALEEIHSMLQRMRELAVQATDDTLTSQNRARIQLEIDKLKDGIDRIAERIAETIPPNEERLLDDPPPAPWSSDELSAEEIIRAWQLQNQYHGEAGRG